MIIYSYKGSYKDEKKALLEKAWFLESHGEKMPIVISDDKGKPFFEDGSAYFSISHSHEYWVCVFSPLPIGIDIQYRKSSRNELLIARRFFSKEEAAIVENDGTDSFYKVWTIREALGKYLGTGFFLPEEIRYYPIIKEFTIGDEYQGAIATEEDAEIWIKTIS